MDIPLLLIIPLAFLIIFPLFWSGIVALIGIFGGWRSLADRYGTEREPQGEGHKYKSARFGWTTNYNGVLNVHFELEGLYMRTAWMFKPGHQPLLIPYDRLSIEGENDWSFTKTMKVKVDRGSAEKPIIIHFSGKQLVNDLNSHINQNTLKEKDGWNDNTFGGF